jgi:hypothetical protein
MSEPKVTEVQRRLSARWRLRTPLYLLGAAVVLIGIAAIVVGLSVLARFSGESTPRYADIREHYKYGSIGSEPESGLPVYLWKALPGLFPEVFGTGRFEVFGFLYEDGRDLPIGVSRRTVRGIELGWLNCAVCHTGTVRQSPDARREVILGMPSNNLDFHAFVAFVLGAADDPRLAPDSVLAELERQGIRLGRIERLVWRHGVLPQVREGLIERRARLAPLLALQPPWGPGRVDTFNPYKLIQFDMRFEDLTEEERIGTADFPSIFLQGPREGMELHWDGNNTSLQERNLSAAIGAGVTEETVDHPAIERVAEWLVDLEPPPSPYRPDPDDVAAGREIYMADCAACHGYQDGERYVFEGPHLGTVEPNERLGVDPARLDSYTPELRDYQLTLFAGDPRYRFRHFTRTDGYANLPLDGLWLRAPYLHNGAVPTLYDLLLPPEQRPTAWVRGLDVLDPERGGFTAPACVPGEPLDEGFCFDTTLPGNGNGGHVYGTDLDEGERAALLAYLLTF